MLVGTKAIATLSTGYLNALEYAKERVQGPDLTRAADKSAPRVTITHHPDVRRSLMNQKAFAEGLRALVLYTASIQDRVASAKADGTTDEAAVRLNDLLLPIVKGYGSERSWVLLGTESLQTFGGSGYLTDYPIEQYVRDAKIDTLYEGTTAIQGQDLFFRKIVRDQGAALTDLSEQIAAWHRRPGSGNGQLKEERDLLEQALDDAGGIVATMVGRSDRLGDRRRPAHDLPGRPEHHSAADGPGRRDLRLAAAARRRGRAAPAERGPAGPRRRRSTRARSPRPAGSRARCCRSSPPSEPSPRRPTWPSWTCPRTPSEKCVVDSRPSSARIHHAIGVSDFSSRTTRST